MNLKNRKKKDEITNSPIKKSKIVTRCFIVLGILFFGFIFLLTIGINPMIIVSEFFYMGDELKIEPNTSVSGLLTSNHTFRIGAENITIVASANADIYYGALESLERFWINNSGYSIYQYYNWMTFDNLENEFYDTLLNQFRVIKDKKNLSEDEYVDLLTAYVQSIPYNHNSTRYTMYPIVTAIKSSGDCDDKSLLLASLLAKEGYDVELMIYPNSNHMGIGIRTNERDNISQINSEYARKLLLYNDYYEIELTRGSLIPCDISSISGTDTKYQNPRTVHIGNGTKSYNKGVTTIKIIEYYDDLTNLLNKSKTINITSNLKYNLLNAINDAKINAFDRSNLYEIIQENPIAEILMNQI